jgi:hypothetical protein
MQDDDLFAKRLLSSPANSGRLHRVMQNPIPNAKPVVDEAHHRVSAVGFKYYVTEMVCWATGGPRK